MHLLKSNGETCSEREREAAVRRDILASGSAGDRRDGQTRTKPNVSLAVSAHCLRR